MNYWINVVSKDHVDIGKKEGIIQAGHGKEAPLKKLKKGDKVLFYSPKISLTDKKPYQQFTAIAQIVDDDIYQVEVREDFKPYRRKVIFTVTQDTSILPLLSELSFIKDKTHWGFMFRFGLFKISEEDFTKIASKMII